MINGNRFHLDHINIMELKPIFIAVGSRVRLMMEGQIIRCESARLHGFLEAAVTYPPHNMVNPQNSGDVRVVAGIQPAAGNAHATDGAIFSNVPAQYEAFRPNIPHIYEPVRATTPGAYEAVPFGNDAIDMTHSDEEEQIELVNTNVLNVLSSFSSVLFHLIVSGLSTQGAQTGMSSFSRQRIFLFPFFSCKIQISLE